MLAIRMKRTGRRGHAQYRVVVQDSRLSPASGRVVAYLGSYNPHTKTAVLDTEKASTYLNNGAQPSDRIVKLFQKEGVELPKWVSTAPAKKRAIRNPEKLRRNRPLDAAPEEPAAEETAAEASTEQEDTAAEPQETPAEAAETAADEPSA